MEGQNTQTKKYKAVVIEEYKKPLIVKEFDIPIPQNGEVLIRVESAPINPSDLSFLNGFYSAQKAPPCTPGFEGSGVVIQSGGGFMGWSLNGKRVAFSPQKGFTGTWGEYAIADAMSVIPVPDEVSFDAAACSIVNPLTVICMLDTVKDQNVTCVISTAASSALGRMLQRYFTQNGVQVINIIRRDEQIDILKKEGAEYILNQNSEKFDEDLKELARKLNAKIAFDAVAGELTNKVLTAMPKNSTVYVYGALELKPCQIDPGQLIFAKKTVKGYWLTEELQKKNLVQKVFLMNKVKGLLNTQLKTTISKVFTYEQANEAIEYYTKHMSEGKVLLKKSTQQ